MLDQIVGLIKDQAVDHFTNKTDVPNEKAGEAAQAAGESIFDGLKGEVMSGNVEGITGLLSGASGGSDNSGLMNNPIAKGIMSNFTGKLTGLGISSDAASSASSSGIPALLSSVIGKFSSSDSADSAFDVNSLVSMVGKEQGKNMVMDFAKKKLGDLF